MYSSNTIANNNNNKFYLLLCELHHPSLHGKTHDSDPYIETHYLVYDRYDPITGIAYVSLENNEDYDTDNEYDSDSSSNYSNNTLIKLNDDIKILRQKYKYISNHQLLTSHPTITNYTSIINKRNYIKPEIGTYIILPTQEAITILKTFWLRIIQKKWKKVFIERKNIIRQRFNITNLSLREIYGRWPESCFNLPGIRGILSDLKH